MDDLPEAKRPKQAMDQQGKSRLCKVQDYPKPQSGHLVVIYTAFCSSTVNARPSTYFKIPCGALSDEQWQLLIECNNVFDTGELDEDDGWTEEDQKKIQTIIDPAIDLLHSPSLKPYRVKGNLSSLDILKDTKLLVSFGRGSW